MTARPAHADTDERRQRRIALVATVLLNGIFLVLLESLMRPSATPPAAGVPSDTVDVLLVRLIEPLPPPEPPAAVSSETAPPADSTAAQPRRPRRAAESGHAAAYTSQQTLPAVQPAAGFDAAASDAAVAAVESAPPPLRLYDQTGRVLLPDAPADGAAVVSFPDRPRVAREGNPFVHRSPLPYTPTRLDKYWPSVRETLGGELVRKATMKRVSRTPWGTQVECTWVLFFGGCSWGAEPRATAEELQQMRADPPMPKSSSATDTRSGDPSPRAPRRATTPSFQR